MSYPRNRNGHCPITGWFLAKGRKNSCVRYVKDVPNGTIYSVHFDRVGRCVLINAEHPSQPPLIVNPMVILQDERFVVVS